MLENVKRMELESIKQVEKGKELREGKKKDTQRERERERERKSTHN
jgi:hypothetical protein